MRSVPEPVGAAAEEVDVGQLVRVADARHRDLLVVDVRARGGLDGGGVDGVKVAGFTNLPGRIAADASALYAKNLLALLPLFTGENAAYGPKWDDEIVKAAVLTRDGQVVHPALKDG